MKKLILTIFICMCFCFINKVYAYEVNDKIADYRRNPPWNHPALCGDCQVPQIFRCDSGPHRSELWLQPERYFLQGPGAGRSWGLPQRCGRGPWRDDGQHHCGVLQTDGRYPARCGSGAGGYQQLSVGHWREAASHSHLPHGSGQPLQRRVPAWGNQPPYCGHHLGCEHGLFGACPALFGRHRPAQGTHLCHRLPDGGSAA